MKSITRNTEVVSISLPKSTAAKLDEVRQDRGQSRSALISSLIEKEAEEKRWQEIQERGRQIAKKFNITSEDDIDRIIHEP